MVRVAQPVRKIAKLQPSPPPPALEPQKSALREYAEAFGVALILAIVLRTFFIQAYKIPSGSMERTLLVGDHIIVNKLDYGFRLPDSIFGKRSRRAKSNLADPITGKKDKKDKVPCQGCWGQFKIAW